MAPLPALSPACAPAFASCAPAFASWPSVAAPPRLPACSRLFQISMVILELSASENLTQRLPKAQPLRRQGALNRQAGPAGRTDKAAERDASAAHYTAVKQVHA